MHVPVIVAGLTIGLLLAVAGAAGAQTPAPTLPAGCVVTSAGLQCAQLPQGCVVTSAGLQCPPGSGVESATGQSTATATPTATPTPAKKPRQAVRHERESSPPAPVAATSARPPAPLPFTGAEPLPLAALGAVLVGLGLALRRRSAPS